MTENETAASGGKKITLDIGEERYVQNMRAIVECAAGNWPRSADIRFETCGCDPKASATIPAYLLRKILDAVV